MNYEIIKLEEFSGTKATIYSALPYGEVNTLYDNFVDEYHVEFREEIVSIADLLEDMGHKYGIRENLIKMNEYKPGDGIVAIYDNPDKNLRLYGIRYGSCILVIGSGGVKPKEIKAWQENEKLSKEIEIVKEISEDILQRINDRDIVFSTDGLELSGNLNFQDNEQ